MSRRRVFFYVQHLLGIGHLRRAATITRAMSMEDLPEFLSPEEFRTYVGIGRATCYDLIRRGLIPSVRFGRLIRIPKSALLGQDEHE